jgi:putative FmdB family regulatory protein
MPIYEYRCLQCGDETEVIQRIDAAPKRRCAKCPGRLEKLISRSAFHLKGGGWFSEGYSRGSGSESKSKSSTST